MNSRPPMTDEDAAVWLEVLLQTGMDGYRASIKDAVAHAMQILRGQAARRPMSSWSSFENTLITLACTRVSEGKSIYSQVTELKTGPLHHRTWEAIRARMNRELHNQAILKRGRPHD